MVRCGHAACVRGHGKKGSHQMIDGKDEMTMTVRRTLTGGQKAGFFFLGFLGGAPGVLAASLMNLNMPYRPQGTKLAACGFLTAILIGLLLFALVSCTYAAMPIERCVTSM